MEVYRQILDKEIAIHSAKIRDLYSRLDRLSGLDSSSIPIEFGYDKEVLGKYQNKTANQKELFYFSLMFIGYGVPKPLNPEDRIDLYKHEYAHFMQYNMEIPQKYQWEPGIHGSAWKYCCSIVGAAPTPYYKAGEALMHHDYEKKLKNPIHDKTVPIRDIYRREKAYRDRKNAEIRFKIGDVICHPKYGDGIVEQIQATDRSVALMIRFLENQELRKIDQAWLWRSMHK